MQFLVAYKAGTVAVWSLHILGRLVTPYSETRFTHILNRYEASNPKQPSCKKVCGPQKGYGEKRCEIQGGGQEMAVMVG